MSNEIFDAILLAGIPVFVFSLVLSYWAYKSPEEPDLDDPEQLDFTISPEPESSDKETKLGKSGNYLHSKWVEFGGGYYGIIALLTYLHIELLEISQAFAAFESIQQFFQTVSAEFFIGLIINAITNVITAFIWWTYWDDVLPVVTPVTWLIVSYIAYISANGVVKAFSVLKKD